MSASPGVKTEPSLLSGGIGGRVGMAGPRNRSGTTGVPDGETTKRALRSVHSRMVVLSALLSMHGTRGAAGGTAGSGGPMARDAAMTGSV